MGKIGLYNIGESFQTVPLAVPALGWMAYQTIFVPHEILFFSTDFRSSWCFSVKTFVQYFLQYRSSWTGTELTLQKTTLRVSFFGMQFYHKKWELTNHPTLHI